jgi:hypothetical protein
MTEDTLAVLQRFQVEVLGQPSRPPDRGRIYQVLDELIAAHTPPLTEEQIQEAFPNRVWTDLPVLVDLVLDSELYRTLNDAAPSFDASLAIVRKAVREDERAGRLPWHSPGYVEGFESEAIPRQWFEYQFDRDAHLVGDWSAFQVEKARLVLGEASVRYTPRDRDSVTVEIDLPYRVDGLADSPSFMMPLPVLQTETLSGKGPETWIEPTTGGEEHVQARFEVPVASLRDGSLRWEAVVQPYGLAPELVEVGLRLPEQTDESGPDTDTVARQTRSPRRPARERPSRRSSIGWPPPASPRRTPPRSSARSWTARARLPRGETPRRASSVHSAERREPCAMRCASRVAPRRRNSRVSRVRPTGSTRRPSEPWPKCEASPTASPVRAAAPAMRPATERASSRRSTSSNRACARLPVSPPRPTERSRSWERSEAEVRT